MTETNEAWILRRNRLKYSYEALYREVATHFGLSTTAAWVLYMLMDAGGQLTQRKLLAKWHLPRQTVQSCIQTLSQDGYLNLSVIPRTRNHKLISLTEQGRELVDQSTRLLAQAEERAAARLTPEERTQYLALSQKFHDALQAETQSVRK